MTQSKFPWSKVKLKDLVIANEIQLGRGNIISKIDLARTPGNYPVYSSSVKKDGRIGEYGKYMFEEELITWSVDGGGNFFYRPRHRYSVTNISGYLRLKTDRYIYKYLYYLLYWQHQRQTFDYTYKAHPSVIVEQYFVFDIDVDEQRSIARILDKADEAIQKAERVITKQERERIGLLSDLLRYGLDENGNLRDPIAHPEQFLRDNASGTIPIAWKVVELSELLINIEAGKSPQAMDTPSSYDEWGVLKVSAIKPGGFASQENKLITNPKHINPGYEVHQGDLLISRANTRELVGLVSLVRDPVHRLMLSDKTLRLVVNSDKAEAEFVFYAMQMPYVRFQIEINATGSSATMKNISQSTIRSIKIAIPEPEEQRAIVHVLQKQQAIVDKSVKLRDKLIAKKQGLMDDLLTGRVRVAQLNDEELENAS